MTFPAGVAQQQGGQQAPSQGGWQQVPVPNGPVQQPNFNDPAFGGQQQGHQSQQVPQTQYGYDGGAVQIGRPSYPQQQQASMQQQAPMQQQQAQQATVQVDPWGRPVQQGQPSQQVPNQGQMHQQRAQQGSQPSGQVQFDAQGRMFGPGVPQELQGRTLQEGLQAYGMMRQTALGAATRPTQQQMPATPQAAPAQQVGAQAQARSFWADPEGAIERIVDQRMAPVTQATQLQRVQGARDVVAQQFPQFLQYESQVIERLQGMNPEVLANPEAWRLAFQQVVGEATLTGRFPGGGQQQQGQQSSQQQAQGWQPYQNNNGPRYGDFFTESPAAGFSGNGAPSDGTAGLNPAQQEMARRFGMTNQQYAQGMGM